MADAGTPNPSKSSPAGTVANEATGGSIKKILNTLPGGSCAAPLITCGCWSIIAIIILGMAIYAFSEKAKNSAEPPPEIQVAANASDSDASNGDGTTTGPHGNTPVDSSDIPKALQDLFNKIGRETGVPPALLAATSRIECGRIWSVPEEILTQWIASNAIVDFRGCAGNNWAGASGPAQFIGDTWAGIGPRTTKYTGNPAPNRDRILDAFYGMAMLHRENHAAAFGAGASYTDAVIREVGRRYCNGSYNESDQATVACAAHINTGTVGYGAGILHYYQRYQGF